MTFENRIQDVDRLKKEIDNYRPFSAHVVQQLKEYFRIGLTYSSNALEGNSLTETETKVILEDGLTIGGKPMRDHLEAVGHSKAYDYMLSLTKRNAISEADILYLHALFYSGLDLSNAGKYRLVPVFVTGTDFEFPAPSKVPFLMKKFVDELQELSSSAHPVEFAALAHLKLVTIHPFIDGNGRTARLLMNFALMHHGYGITIIPPIMRSDYISAIRIGNKGNTQPFVDFISNMVYESQKDYVRMLRALHTN